MMTKLAFFNVEEHLSCLSMLGDQLKAFSWTVDFKTFCFAPEENSYLFRRIAKARGCYILNFFLYCRDGRRRRDGHFYGRDGAVACPKWAYRCQHLVENLWASLRQWRSVATRYEKIAMLPSRSYTWRDRRTVFWTPVSWFQGYDVLVDSYQGNFFSAFWSVMGITPPELLHSCTDPLQKYKAAHVVDDVGSPILMVALVMPTVLTNSPVCDF